MRRYNLIGTALCSGVLALWGSGAQAEEFSARLDGFQEIGSLTAPTGAVLSDATGTLHLDLDRKSKTVRYKLTYTNVGTTPPMTPATVTQGHIHFGKDHVAGQVMVFFCTNLAPPAGVPTPPPCTSPDGTFSGTFTGANVLAQPSQNIALGDFDALADALTSNTAYANVHTTNFGAGEIRGQIHKGDLDDNHDDNHEHK
jgi:hypothetical protein